jgi:hypothetical protein
LHSIRNLDSKSLFFAFKVAAICGACMVVLGSALQFAFTNGSVDLNYSLLVLGALALVAAVFLRKKAVSLQRRFDWREKYNQIPA